MKVFRPAFAGLIGVSRWDITPPTPIYARNWGAAEHDFAEGVERSLTGTALAFQAEGGRAPLVLISLDLGFWRSKEEEWRFRGALLEATALEEANLIVHLTHTHAGPGTEYDLEREYQPEVATAYLASVEEACVKGIRAALADLEPATLVMGSGRCDLATNRDLPDPEREGVWVCGYNPAKEADDTLWVGMVFREDGGCKGTLVNYACHPTTLAWQNRRISPDFPGPMRDLVEAETGGPCLFYNGACGELSPLEQYTDDHSVVTRNGRRLGYAVLSVLEGMGVPPHGFEYTGHVESGAPLGIWGRTENPAETDLKAEILEIELPVKADLPDPEAVEADLQRGTQAFERERLRRKLKPLRSFAGRRHSNEYCWAWRLGSIFLVAHAFEAYSDLQVSLRSNLPAGAALLVGNRTNGWGGYLPPESEYGKDLYQVWQTPFERGSLEALIDCYASWIHLER